MTKGWRTTRTDADQTAAAGSELRPLETKATIARTFAYATGPAYGLLLDRCRPRWREEIRGGVSLAELAAQAVGRPEPATADREGRYARGAIRDEEGRRAAQREARRRDLVARFVAGPILILPLAAASIGFDPAGAESFDSLGTVYGGLRLTDQWRVLEAAESWEVKAGAEAVARARSLPGNWRSQRGCSGCRSGAGEAMTGCGVLTFPRKSCARQNESRFAARPLPGGGSRESV